MLTLPQLLLRCAYAKNRSVFGLAEDKRCYTLT